MGKTLVTGGNGFVGSHVARLLAERGDEGLFEVDEAWLPRIAAALDPRVKVAVVSAYFNTFRDSIVSISHCPDNYVPGLLHDVEMYDVSGLVAPRALFVEGGTQDDIFPLHAFRQAVARAQEIYSAFAVPDRFGFEVFEGGHQFYGKGAFRFLEQYL